MKRVNLYVKEVIRSTEKQEQGLVLAMRACKSVVYSHLREGGRVYGSYEELSSSFANEFGEGYREEVMGTVADACMEYPLQYEAAMRWLTDRLIEVWKGEAMEDYFNRTRLK